jgi:hypothetical protein
MIMTSRSLLPALLCAVFTVAPATGQSENAAASLRSADEPPSPEQVLGHALGERFTDHAGVVRYFEALAAAAPRQTRLERYGSSVEGRPLLQLVIGRDEHMARLDEVLAMNRELAEPSTTEARARQIAAANPAVVYFSYGVHGNESSSSEAALWTAWDLVRGAPAVAGVLDEVVVVIDPAVNPDGRDRYVNWFRQAVGARPNPNPESREHWEPWPGGRFNHYLFDLNRDWAWATQPETRARLATWDRFSPQVHVDFHEMSFTSTYFFFPAAEPINPLYPEHILRWGRIFGEANAAAFNARGWPYYTGESFDLFYPGYGDSWPSLLGAIGMTYEQAGSGRAGLAVVRPDGDTLTLHQRATQHWEAGTATLRAAAQRKAELLGDFAAFHRRIDAGLPDILLVPGDAARMNALLELLDRQGIRVERAQRAFRADATAHTGYGARRDFPAGTYLVRARQPRGRLAVTLLQPETVLDATFSYDVSAWSLPFAYGIEAHSARRLPAAGWAPATPATEPPPATGVVMPANPFGALVAPGFERWPGVLAYIRSGGRVVALERPFTMAGRDWPAGTLFLPRGAQTAAAFAERITAAGLADAARPIASAMASTGPDLGTNNALTLAVPRIALLAGDGVAATSYGAHWFFLEQSLGLEFDAVPTDRFAGTDLAPYDVIVLPDMGRGPLTDQAIEGLKSWVERGGTLIASAGGARSIGAALAEIAVREAPAEPDSLQLRRALAGREDRRLERWEQQVPGTILSVHLDSDHPLAAGAGLDPDPARLFVLHSGGLSFEPHERFETVAYFADETERVSGVISSRNLERLSHSSWLAVRRVGRGRVILFADDPVFRHFWYGTFQPFANALIVGPAL